MAFQGVNIEYDGKPSETFGLYLTSINSGESEDDAGGSIELITDKVRSSPKFDLMGIEYTDPLTFTMELSSPSPIDDRFTISQINKWLVGHRKYKKLIIEQEDMREVHYNCIITSMSNVYYANQAYSFRCNVVCDAPWAWESVKTKQYMLNGSYTNNIEFYNSSDDTDLMFPIFKIEIANNTDISIINRSLNDLTMSFNGLTKGEIIKIDCNKGILESSVKQYLAGNFNKEFLSLGQGKNQLEVRGYVKRIDIIYQNARKVGV